MMIRNYKTAAFLAVATALLLSACANQMEPAQQAIAGIDSAISAASPDAAKYIPDQLTAVQAKLADLKAAFDKKDYAAVLAGAPALLADAQGLLGTAALKKDEVLKAMTGEWNMLSTSVSTLVTAVSTRAAKLGKHVPEGVDAAGLTALWSKAQGAFAAGNVEEAVTTAKDVKAKAEAAAAALKIKLPGAAPAAK